jgi:mRNA-degrading endonuclease toxin of MazEF toxin-antitoxin module
LVVSATNRDKGLALKIPLSELPDSKVNIRSALNRATRKLGKPVATATDNESLYVWNS